MNTDQLYLEGNNGGDYLVIKPLPSGCVHLIVGHCCVRNIHHIVPVEFITAILSTAVIKHGSVQAAIKAIDWPKDFTKELATQVEER